MKNSTKVFLVIVLLAVAGSILAGVPGFVKEFQGSLWPSASCKYDLGSAHRKWERIYVQKVVADTNPVNASDLPDSVGFLFVYVVDCSIEHLHYTLPSPPPSGAPDTVSGQRYFDAKDTVAGIRNLYPGSTFRDTVYTNVHHDTLRAVIFLTAKYSDGLHCCGLHVECWIGDSSFAVSDPCLSSLNPALYFWKIEDLRITNPITPIIKKKGKTK